MRVFTVFISHYQREAMIVLSFFSSWGKGMYLCFSLVTLNSKGCIAKAELCLLAARNETEIKSSDIDWPQSWPFIF